jgi:protein-S-isoprenylcysteine O-methyltransferase Ste14
MPLAVPISTMQVWAFMALSLLFFWFLLRAAARKTRESGGRSDSRSRFGIILQSLGIGLACIGPARSTVPSFSLAGVSATLLVVLLTGGTIALFAASSRALGENWSLVARTRSDHELVRDGPYGWVRHPIYLGMLLFLLGLAVAWGHWLQLVLALPIFVAGTAVRIRLEEALLHQNFGSAFEEYRRSTPALIPGLF